jgi:type I restriction enzyme R subunit
VELEELYVFTRHLNKKLPKRDNYLPYEVQDAVDLDSFRIQQTFKGKIELEKDDGELSGITTGTHQYTEDERDLISNIIRMLNEAYGLNLTEEDKVDIERIKIKLESNEELRSVMNPDNTLANIRYKFDKVIDDLLLEFVNTKIDLYKKLTDPKVNPLFKQKWFEKYYGQYEGQSGHAGQSGQAGQVG